VQKSKFVNKYFFSVVLNVKVILTNFNKLDLRTKSVFLFHL